MPQHKEKVEPYQSLKQNYLGIDNTLVLVFQKEKGTEIKLSAN